MTRLAARFARPLRILSWRELQEGPNTNDTAIELSNFCLAYWNEVPGGAAAAEVAC